MRWEARSGSEEETEATGRRLGQAVWRGDVIGLSGPLGVGKTCFVRGLVQGIGGPIARVRSPSFTLISTYRGGRFPLYHIDLYRMQPGPLDRLALREYLYSDGVSAIEWIERLGDEVESLRVDLQYLGSHERRIRVWTSGDRHSRLVQAIRG